MTNSEFPLLPTARPVKGGYVVSGSAPIHHEYAIEEDILTSGSPALAKFLPHERTILVIIDRNVYEVHGKKFDNYFAVHGLTAKIHPVTIVETRKDVEMLLEMCQLIDEFGLHRTDPVLAVGGGLITDVVGFACAILRRGVKYIRMPTSLLGMIDASVATKVGVNWHGAKNHLGAFYEPFATVIDYSFLSSSPEREVRNGLAEIVKVLHCVDKEMFDLLDQHADELISTRMGTISADAKLKSACGKILDKSKLSLCSSAPYAVVVLTLLSVAIYHILEAEIPNHRELNCNRFMYSGHTWSPTIELKTEPHLMHGHAVAIDMGYTAQVACIVGVLSENEKMRLLNLLSRLGLTVDCPEFSADILQPASIKAMTGRDGHLRLPVPINKLGEYQFLMDVDEPTLLAAFEVYKATTRGMAREGAGVEATISFREIGQ